MRFGLPILQSRSFSTSIAGELRYAWAGVEDLCIGNLLFVDLAGSHQEPHTRSALPLNQFRIYRACGLGLTLRLKMAQKTDIIWTLGPKASKYESLEPQG